MAVPGSVLIDTDTSTSNILFKPHPARAAQVNKSISHYVGDDISSQSDPRRSEVSPGGGDVMQSASDDDDDEEGEEEEENKISVADVEPSNTNTDIILSPPSPPSQLPASDNHTTEVTPTYHVVEPSTTPEHLLSARPHTEQSDEQKAQKLNVTASMTQVDTSSLIGKYIFVL